jgi:hypothetical protein
MRQEIGNAGDAKHKQQARNDLSGIHGSLLRLLAAQCLSRLLRLH